MFLHHTYLSSLKVIWNDQHMIFSYILIFRFSKYVFLPTSFTMPRKIQGCAAAYSNQIPSYPSIAMPCRRIITASLEFSRRGKNRHGAGGAEEPATHGSAADPGGVSQIPATPL